MCQTLEPTKKKPGKRQGGLSNTGHRFLVDTGAQVSVIPPTWFDKHHGQRGPPLQSANGTSITTYGS
ncbi:retrovirus-related pol polyprotein [Plakobranchus ocellatus]|uniref:Retrovirus-related pol polyprotein n=1 Tax=Plakobranchus ocellatus TaxID=259542 RepID=A0AAV4C729_9GAST|nr:retrovirus-related pol polyprotein [Plakobranchus ocellatus]